MRHKAKRQTKTLRRLSHVARFLAWIGWIGVIVSFMYAFQRFGDASWSAWASGSFYHNFHFMIWQPFTTAFVFFLGGGFPSGISILIGHLITRVLRLEDENAAQEDLIQTLMRERDEIENSHRLLEDDVPDEALYDDDVYEQIYTRR